MSNPNKTSTKVQQARKAHSSHVWPTSKTWPKRDPPGPHQAQPSSPAVMFGPRLKHGPNMTSPYLFPSSLKQTWNKLDHASTPSKSQAKPTLHASTFRPHFLPSPNVTQGKASSPWSRFCHVLASPKCDSNVTSPQAPQALPSFKQ
ncbi:hypothetical protein PIB30_077033, partial [Stylosanthes scabra]|nr:hypothetical protein [Stylosanthes scabra]